MIHKIFAPDLRFYSKMTVNRRTVIKRVGAIGVAVGVAGCIGDDLSVESVDTFTTAFNNVGLNVLVSNSSSSAKTGTLSGTVDLTDGGAYSDSKSITVSGDSSEWFELRFDLSWSEQISGGEFTYDVSIE